MRGRYRLSQSDDSLNETTSLASGLTAGASLSLEELGALELNYFQANSALKDGVHLDNSLSRGYGAHHLYGPKAGNGGLIFSVNYSYSGANELRKANCKLGLTYR